MSRPILFCFQYLRYHGRVAGGLVFALLAGCAPEPEGETAAQGRPGARDSSFPIPVAIAYARVGEISSYYETTATLVARNEADVLARVAGIVDAIAVEEGDTVLVDGSLLRIQNDEYRFRVDQAEANRKNLHSKLERLKSMEAGLISADELETAEKDFEAAAAAEGLARLSLSYTDVRAPFAGQVTRRYTDVGQNVMENTPLFTVADFSPLLARVGVPAKEFRKLQIDQDVELVLDSNGERLGGTISLVSPIIDPSTGTIKVTIEISEYPERTRPGDFASVAIVTETHVDSTLVPRAAVFTDKSEQVVFVAVNRQAERRVVTVGFQNDEESEILSGVDSDEAIVVKGQRSLKHGAHLKVLEGERRPEPAKAAEEAPAKTGEKSIAGTKPAGKSV